MALIKKLLLKLKIWRFNYQINRYARRIRELNRRMREVWGFDFDSMPDWLRNRYGY